MTLTNRIIIMGTLCILLSGCSLIPHYERPSSPVPQQYPYGSASKGQGKLAYDVGWHEFFKDPRLQKLIELALQNNRDYRVSMLNVQETQAQFRIVRYGLLPSFGLNADSNRQRGIATSSTYFKTTTYQADVNTSYELDVFGAIRSLKAQVLEQYFATEEAGRAAQISLVAEVAMQYLTICALDEQMDLLQTTLKSVSSYEDLIDKSYQLGNSTALDLKLAQTQVETINASVADYARQRAQAQDALVLLVGESLPDDLPSALSLESEDLLSDLPTGTSSDLIERRPDILQAEHQLKAANDNIGIVRSNFFPSITLTASDGSASVKLNKLFTHGTGIWAFSPEISLPLFNENTNLANLNAAWISEKIEVAQYEKAVQNAFREVSDALVARDTFNAQLSAQQKLVADEKDRLSLSSARYHSGIDNYLTVLLAQQDLYNAQANLIQVSLGRFSNLISLYKALGGGWSS